MKLAVILPAYNAERTLPRALDSLLAQTHTHLEIWIVNDGSTDATGAIADTYARKDPRIHVLHQPNQRLYATRLRALQRITAEYFTFLDADDALAPEAYAETLAFIDEHHLDMAIFDIQGLSLPATTPYDLYLTPDAIRTHVIHAMLALGYPLPYLCNKIYRNTYDVATIPSYNLHTFEDLVLNLTLFQPLQRVGHLHKAFYHYNITPASSVSNISHQKLDDFALAQRLRYQSLTQTYGYSPDDPSHSAWLIRNARVALILIATAPHLRWSERLQLHQRLLSFPTLNEALATHRGASARLLRLSRRFPRTLFLLLRPLRALWKRLPLKLRLKN